MIKTYRASFVKQNGERRLMTFVKLKDLPRGFVDSKIKGTGSKRTLLPGFELVWDLDKQEFRIFNWNTQIGEIEEFEINKEDLH